MMHTRGRARWRAWRAVLTTAAITGTAVVLAGCTGGATSSVSPESGATSGAPSTVSTATAEPAPEHGTWETDPVTRKAFLATLQGADLQRFRRTFQQKADWLPQESAVMSLELGNGSWTLYAAFDEQPPSVFDRQTYESEGDRFVLTSSVGQSVFEPAFEGDDLTLSFVSSTEPDVEGVPVEAVLRTYYTAAAFHRVEP